MLDKSLKFPAVNDPCFSSLPRGRRSFGAILGLSEVCVARASRANYLPGTQFRQSGTPYTLSRLGQIGTRDPVGKLGTDSVPQNPGPSISEQFLGLPSSEYAIAVGEEIPKPIRRKRASKFYPGG